MSAVGPGDLVACIEGHRDDLANEIVAGRIYVVTEVVEPERLGICAHGRHCHAGGFALREAPVRPGHYWCAGCFKPVGRPAADFIASMLEAPADGVAA